MLILSRRINERIVIGDEIVITVPGVKGNQIRVGVEAPTGVSIHREEIYQKIQQEQKQEKPEEKEEIINNAKDEVE